MAKAQKGGTASQAISKSKGGMTSKILALTDAWENLARFVLLSGQRFDTVGVPPRIVGITFDALIAGTAFDSNAVVAELDERGAKAVISQHPRRTSPLPILQRDDLSCRSRHQFTLNLNRP